MHVQAMNHYGNFNRGFGGQPQPQRQGRGRGNFRGGFRNSRFEHNNQRGPNQGQRPNEQQQNKPTANQADKPKNPPAAQQNNAAAKPAATQPVQNQAPAVQNQASAVQQQKPAQITPAKPAQQPQAPAAKPQPKQPQPQQQQAPAQQNAAPKSLMADKIEKPVFSPNQQQKPMNGGNFGGSNNIGGNNASVSNNNSAGNTNRGTWQGGPGGNRQGGPGNKPFGQRQGAGGPGGPAGGGAAAQGPAPRNQRNNNRGPQQNDGKLPAERAEHMLASKLKELQGPLLELPPLEAAEVKFNGRSRLYIGNLSSDLQEEDIMKMFSAYGEPAELFINKEKNFGFIKMDYRENAEKAKRELDGKMKNGRPMRVRFAPHNSAVRVRNLPAFVSNELLYRAFEIFGKIERVFVKVDERGKPLGEGVVEFARKPSAQAALRHCTEKCFFLTASLRPVIVENYEEPDEVDGLPERNLPRKHPEFARARGAGPRFSEPGSFEHEYGTRWKQLHELHRQKEDALRQELQAEEEKLEAQMEYAKYEHETELLREQLRAREQDRERQKRSWEMAERAADERRGAERAQLQRSEGELAQRMRQQDNELRRRQQENTLFVQAQRLNSMLDRQDQAMFDSSPLEGGREQFGGRGFDEQQARGWDGPRPMDDFPNKRRRY